MMPETVRDEELAVRTKVVEVEERERIGERVVNTFAKGEAAGTTYLDLLDEHDVTFAVTRGERPNMLSIEPTVTPRDKTKLDATMFVIAVNGRAVGALHVKPDVLPKLWADLDEFINDNKHVPTRPQTRAEAGTTAAFEMSLLAHPFRVSNARERHLRSLYLTAIFHMQAENVPELCAEFDAVVFDVTVNNGDCGLDKYGELIPRKISGFKVMPQAKKGALTPADLHEWLAELDPDLTLLGLPEQQLQ